MASRDELEPIQEFVEQFEVGGFDHAVDESGEIWSYYGIFTQPSFAFIDDDGQVSVFLGAMGFDGLSSTIEETLLQ